MEEARIGIIGGTGLYQMEGLENVREVELETPFGRPSDALILGELQGERVAFLPRHGRGHPIMPSELPARANIYALKSLGVEFIISVNACGSLKEEIAPLHVVVPDQIFDRTRARVSSFFGQGIAAHIGFADPFCSAARRVLLDSCRAEGATAHDGGTFICMEGPAFSTKAESRIYRGWGADIIGMTILPEAKLAREAEICCVSLAMVTDYDVWHVSEEAVTIEMVIENLTTNSEMAKRIIRRTVPQLPSTRKCECANALENAIVTQRDMIPEEAKKKLGLLIDRYV
jgi:5'-methylthioadenosine phosphorylase